MSVMVFILCCCFNSSSSVLPSCMLLLRCKLFPLNHEQTLAQQSTRRFATPTAHHVLCMRPSWPPRPCTSLELPSPFFRAILSTSNLLHPDLGSTTAPFHPCLGKSRLLLSSFTLSVDQPAAFFFFSLFASFCFICACDTNSSNTFCTPSVSTCLPSCPLDVILAHLFPVPLCLISSSNQSIASLSSTSSSTCEETQL